MRAAGDEVSDREGGRVPGTSNVAGSPGRGREGGPALDNEVLAVRG